MGVSQKAFADLCGLDRTSVSGLKVMSETWRWSTLRGLQWR